MSGTKIKTLYKNLKTQDETSLETFQELPITFRDMSSTTPAPLDVYLSETKATILLPSSGEVIAQADYGSDLQDKDEVTGLILDKNIANTKFAAIKAANAVNAAYVSVAAPNSGISSASLAYRGNDGTSTVSVSGDEIRLTSATLAGLIDNKTEVVLDGSENKVSISGSLHINVEDHSTPVDVFSVNAETASGTLNTFISATANGFGAGLTTTSISGDLLDLSSTTTQITSGTTNITSNVTINAQEQVVIKLEENDAVGEIFKVETVGNNARGLITAYSEAGGEGVSTLTLSPHELILSGDNAVYISAFGVGADIDIGATHQVNITSEELNVESSGGISLQSTGAGHSVSIESSGLASNIGLTAGGSINLESASSMALETTGTSSDFNVTAGRGINLESASSMSIEAAGSGADVTVTAADTIILSPAGGLKILDLPTNDGNSVGGPGTSGVSTWGPFLLGISSSSSYVYRSDSLGFFTGAHVYSASQNIEPGSAIVLENGAAVVSSQPNSTVCVGVAIASKQYVEGDVLSTGAIDENNAPTHLVKVAAVGDCRASGLLGFNVCNEGGDIQPGDLLVTSSIPGYLMKQADDIIRSSTVGKAMERVTFDENGQATGVYGYVYCG